MRRIRLIRKRNLKVLNILFFASARLFYEAHTNIIFKEFAERKIGEVMPAGIDVEIDKIEGGIFRNLTSENVRVISSQKNVIFGIERLEINYRLWYPLLKEIPFFSGLERENEVIIFIGGSDKRSPDGFFELRGTAENIHISGYIGAAKEDRFFVKGIIQKDATSNFYITKGAGRIIVQAKKENNNLMITGKANHIKFKGMDIIGECRVYLA